MKEIMMVICVMLFGFLLGQQWENKSTISCRMAVEIWDTQDHLIRGFIRNHEKKFTSVANTDDDLEATIDRSAALDHEIRILADVCLGSNAR